MESFEFITQGMADIFINDREIHDTNPETVLYKVLKEIRDIKDTIFDHTTEDSYLYDPVRLEETPKDLPHFKAFTKPAQRENSGRRTPDTRNSHEENQLRRTQQWDHSDTQDHTKTHYLQESRKLELK